MSTLISKLTLDLKRILKFSISHNSQPIHFPKNKEDIIDSKPNGSKDKIKFFFLKNVLVNLEIFN